MLFLVSSQVDSEQIHCFQTLSDCGSINELATSNTLAIDLNKWAPYHSPHDVDGEKIVSSSYSSEVAHTVDVGNKIGFQIEKGNKAIGKVYCVDGVQRLSNEFTVTIYQEHRWFSQDWLGEQVEERA